MKFSCIYIFTFFIGLWANAQSPEMMVIDVRKNIPLSDTDPVYKDFYINAGSESGLKRNQVVTVYRKLSVRDSTGSQTFGELTIPVGRLKLISVQNRLAVAREFNLISREDEPMLEQIGLMVGDRLDLTDSFIDNKKGSAKKSE